MRHRDKFISKLYKPVDDPIQPTINSHPIWWSLLVKYHFLNQQQVRVVKKVRVAKRRAAQQGLSQLLLERLDLNYLTDHDFVGIENIMYSL